MSAYFGIQYLVQGTCHDANAPPTMLPFNWKQMKTGCWIIQDLNILNLSIIMAAAAAARYL